MSTQATVSIAPIEKLLDRIGTGMVFGAPTREGEVTIIPVSQAAFGFGYGSSAETQEPATTPSDAEGGGGGGGGSITPRGFIRVLPDSVVYEPISDPNRIPLAGIFMVAWIVFWVGYTIRSVTRTIARSRSAAA